MTSYFIPTIQVQTSFVSQFTKGFPTPIPKTTNYLP